MRRLALAILILSLYSEARSMEYGACVSRTEVLEALQKEEQYLALVWDNIELAEKTSPSSTPMRISIDKYIKKGYLIRINKEKEYCLLGKLSGLNGGQMLVLNPENKEVSERSLLMKGDPARENGGISNTICRLAANDSGFVVFQGLLTLRSGKQYLQTVFGKTLGEKMALSSPNEIDASAQKSTSIVYTESDGGNIGSDLAANINLSTVGHEAAKLFRGSKEAKYHDACKYEKWLREEWEKKEYDVGGRKMKGGNIDSALKELANPEARKRLLDQLSEQKSSK